VAWNSIGPREAFGVPCYCTDEVTGELAPAVRAYLQGKQLSSKYLGALRTYFQQWIQSRVWDMNTHATIESRRAVGKLRNSVETIQSASDVNHWLGGYQTWPKPSRVRIPERIPDGCAASKLLSVG
jgi:hypothetical protein